MRAGLITFHFAHHYGAQLQAYATMRAVQALGAECQIIDYRLPHTVGTNRVFKSGRSVRDLASNGHTALHYPAFQRRFQRFEDFVAREMALTPRQYSSARELAAEPPDCDVFLAGSDQIWNPYIFQDKQFDPAFLLAFAGEKRRIAYAPSLGVPELPADKAGQLKAFLEPFSALSVREKRGQALLRQAAGREARVVLDPTLLLTGEEWGKLAVPPQGKRGYILCYFVSDPGETAPYAQELARRTGLPIVQLAGARRKIPGAKDLVFDAGPREFLGLFQHAAYVVTNSFHGAVFSLQFQRPFFTSMSPKERREPTWSRIYSLLSRLGCTGRVIGLEETDAIDAPMDYAAIGARLSEARADSLAYLKAALYGEPLPELPQEEQTSKGPVLCRREDCTGCAACASICPVDAITMKPDREGFLRPVVGDTCILCRKCEGVCPILHPYEKGPAPESAWAVWSQREDERVQSSSGGVFSLLVRQVLEQGGAVFGAALEEDKTVRHVCVRREEELAPLRGSKYVQSETGEAFRQVRGLLAADTPVLFVGTACQVDGLLQYLGGPQEKLLTCDLVCHGTPSPAVFRACLDRLEEEQGRQIAHVRFRDKTKGWKRPHFTVDFQDGTSWSEELYSTPFGRGFGASLYLRPACALCRYASTSRPADLTLGDFWGLDEALELPVDRDKGISLVLVHTEKGREALDAAAPGLGKMERPLAEAVAGNPRLASPVQANPRRAVFFAAFAAQPFAQVEKAFLARPPLPYRAAAKVLSPAVKARIRSILK